MAIEDNLTALYHMNDGWTDATGNGHGGIPSGAIIDTTTKKLGAGSGSGDGIDDFVNLGVLGSFGSNLNSGITIAFWIKTADSAASRRVFGAVEELGANDRAFDIGINQGGAGVIQVQYQEGGNQVNKRTTNNTGIIDDTQHLVIIATKASDSSVNIYIDNGSAEALNVSSAGNPTMSDFGEDFYLFADNVRGVPLLHIDCNLDEFVIIDGVWTASERSDFWNGGAGIEIVGAEDVVTEVTKDGVPTIIHRGTMASKTAQPQGTSRIIQPPTGSKIIHRK